MLTQSSQTTSDPVPGLVRAFSDHQKERDPNSTLTKGLVAKVQHDRTRENSLQALRNEWPLLFADADHLVETSASSEEQQLLKHGQALAKAWEKFQRKLPAEQRENLRDKPPSLSVLCNAVRSAGSKWQIRRDESKWGAVKSAFAKLSRSTDDYSQLLAVIPANDKYIALLTGSLSAIVKASIQHEDLALALSESLEQLCDDIGHWRKQVLAHRDVVSMQDDVRELYVVVFEFLTDIFTSWSTSSFNRFWMSFDKNTANKLFDSKKATIKRLTEKLDRAAVLDSQQKIGAIQESLGDIVTKQYFDEMLLKLGGMIQKQLLEQDPRNWSLSQLGVSDVRPLALSCPVDSVVDHASEDRKQLSRGSLLSSISNAAKLLSLPLEQVRSLRDRTSHLEIDRRVVSKLREWISDSRDSRLWIQGEAHVPAPSQNTLTAIALMMASSNSESATISVFCNSLGNGSSSQILATVLDTCVAQVVTLLPEVISTDLELSADRITTCMELDSPTMDKIALFEDLLSLVQRPIVQIIDSFQILEDESDVVHTQHLRAFTELLCKHRTGADVPLDVDKVCFTTDGYVDILAEMVEQGSLNLTRFEAEADERFADDTARFDDVLTQDY